MGVRYNFALEYDGDDPETNDFVGEMDIPYSYDFREWRNMYAYNILEKEGRRKEHSPKTKQLSEGGLLWLCRWDICKIIPQIKLIQNEAKTDEWKEKFDYSKEAMRGTIRGLRLLRSEALKLCAANNLDPKKCEIVWWSYY